MKRSTRIAWLPLLVLAASGSLVLGQTTAGPRGVRSAAGGSDYARVQVFGVEATGNKFVYLFDRSGSMAGAPLAAAKKQLLASLQPLGETQQFDVIFFNHRLLVFHSSSGSRRSAFATESNKRSAAGFVAAVKADGGTDRMAALKRALALRPDVIFFLSDAQRPMLPAELDELAEINDRVGARICAIEFGKGESAGGESSLATLAKANGGQYVYVNTDQLAE